MKLGLIIEKLLSDMYLGKEVIGSTGKKFIVFKVEVEHGWYGDPPIEITLSSEEYEKYNQSLSEWFKGSKKNCHNKPDPLKEKWDEVYGQSISIQSFDEDMPVIVGTN